MLTAKEAREKLDKVVESKLEVEMDYIFSTIKRVIKDDGVNFIQLVHDPKDLYKPVPEKHLNCLRNLGYKIEWVQAVTTMGEVNLDRSITPKGRPMVRKDYYEYDKDGSDPLMCWKVSW